jgi:hypothetical protein
VAPGFHERVTLLASDVWLHARHFDMPAVIRQAPRRIGLTCDKHC